MEPTPAPRKKKSSTKQIVTDNQLERIVSEPLESDYKKIQLARQLGKEQIDMLLNIEGYLGEYLEDFIVIGHAINGLRVNITHAKTPKDLDSLEQYYTDNLILLKSGKMKDIT